MQVTVHKDWRDSWGVILKQDNQSFKLDFTSTKRNAEYFARMFRKALKAHDTAKGKAAFNAVSKGEF